MNDISSLSKDEIVKRAKGHIFSTGLLDSATSLSLANMQYGIAKIHHVQHSMGMDPNAIFIAGPDATVSRNKTRWEYGFGYGGKISWGDGKEKFIILDTMPNACGMIVGGLDELPSLNQLLEGVDRINNELTDIDGVSLQWDYSVGNHFIDLFEIVPLTLDVDFPYKYAFILHGSVPELKGDSEHGCGMYYHRSKTLQERAKIIKTPFGNIHVLTGDHAVEYYDFYKFAATLSKKKRSKAADIIFGDYTEITNPIHQGLLNMNEIILGSHNTKDETANNLFPLALRADLPAYLFQGNDNFTEDAIDFLGFSKRAEKYGVKHKLLNANILPHGGGYMFPQIIGVTRVIETSAGTRYFITEVSSGTDSELVFSNPRELQFIYRGRQVISRTLELDLGTVVARLSPMTVLKV